MAREPVRSTIEVEVRYAETDQMGVVHHANYLVWFEVARTRLCMLSGFHYHQIEELGDAFLRVTVHVPEPQPGVEHRVRELLPDAVEVRQEWPRKEGRRPAAPQRPREPAELFADFHERERGAPPSEALAALFTRVLQQARGEEGAVAPDEEQESTA